MNATDCGKEIQAVANLIFSRRGSIKHETSSKDMEQENALIANLAKKIQTSLVCPMVEAQQLYDILAEGTLDEAYKVTLRDSIDLALTSISQHVLPVSLKPQKLIHLENYLTEDEWKVLQSPEASYIGKCTCIAQRWRNLGIRSLAEQTPKYGVALLLCQLHKLPDHTVIKQMVQDLKSTFHTTPLPDMNLTYVKDFPEKALQLPPALYQAAYANGPPVPKEFEQLKTIAANHIPLRTTSKLLQKQPAVVSSQPAASSQGNVSGSFNPQEAMMGMMMQQVGSLFMSLRESMGLPTGNSPNSQNATGIKLSPGKQQKALTDFVPQQRAVAAIEDTPPCAEQVPVTLPEATCVKDDSHAAKTTEPSGNAEDFEAATFQALKDRQAAKVAAKPKAKGKAQAKVKSQPKPKTQAKASAGKTKGLKRPAAAMENEDQVMKKSKSSSSQDLEPGEYIIPALEPADLNVCRNTYVSRHYSKARAFALRKKHYGEDDAKLYGRKFLKDAGLLWDAAKKWMAVRTSECGIWPW